MCPARYHSPDFSVRKKRHCMRAVAIGFFHKKFPVSLACPRRNAAVSLWFDPGFCQGKVPEVFSIGGWGGVEVVASEIQIDSSNGRFILCIHGLEVAIQRLARVTARAGGTGSGVEKNEGKIKIMFHERSLFCEPNAFLAAIISELTGYGTCIAGSSHLVTV